MTTFEVYVFILCLIVFLSLSIFIGCLIGTIFGLSRKTIKFGAEDDKLIQKYNKNMEEKMTPMKKVGRFFSAALVVIFTAIFASSVAINITSNYVDTGLSTFRVVESDSMSKKDKSNQYLVENDLNDQFSMFDIILTHKLPDEKDLKLYDIVVYDFEGIMIIHRIVGIEEPNASHPNCRYFTLKGDANENVDRYPVLYSQMRSIYEGERVKFIGSFVLFLQSPVGYLCILLLWKNIDEVGRLMFEKMKESYPETYSCVCKIQEFMEKEFKESCSKDELLYLMIHINRLYSKEDCNRKGITPDEN